MSLTVVVSDALVGRDDAARHLVRRQAGILPGHADHRHADVGEDVGRRVERRQRPDDQDEQRQDDEGVRPLQRDANDAAAYRSLRQRWRSFSCPDFWRVEPTSGEVLGLGLSAREIT